MAEVQYRNTNYPTQFQMVSASPPYAGVDGLAGQLVPEVAKNNASFQPARGAVVGQGQGIYALVGHEDDRDQLGGLIVAATIDDPNIVCIPGKYEVKNYDPYASPTQEESDLAQIVAILETLSNNFRVFANEHITSLSKGNIQ